jgi:hypothetical protein
MSALLESRIKKRGFWRIRIRPVDFDAARFPELSSLKKVVNELAIDAGNLSFPTVGSEPFLIGNDWIGQELDVWEYCQSWRLYQSGQLILYEGFIDDWLDRSFIGGTTKDWKPLAELSVSDALYTYWLAFEFAARLALAIEGDDELNIAIHAFGLGNRTGLRQPHVASINDFSVVKRLSRGALIAAPVDHAIGGARELFARFNWDVNGELLRTLLAESGAKV